MIPPPSAMPQGGGRTVLRRGATLPTAAELTAQWAEDSLALRAARPGRLDLPYAAAEACRWDLFPAVNPTAPCLVLLPGEDWQEGGGPEGGWPGGSGSRRIGALAQGLLAHGWSAALPGHSPMPEASLSRILRQGHRALDWLAAQGPLHGINGPVLLCGWNSGAQLAAMLLDHPRVTAGLGISGVYELGAFEERLGLSPLEVEVLSPQRLPVVRKPFALACGEAEPEAVQRQSRAFHALRQEGGGAGPLLPLPGMDGAQALETLRAPDGLLCHTARALIEEG